MSSNPNLGVLKDQHNQQATSPGMMEDASQITIRTDTSRNHRHNILPGLDSRSWPNTQMMDIHRMPMPVENHVQQFGRYDDRYQLHGMNVPPHAINARVYKSMWPHNSMGEQQNYQRNQMTWHPIPVAKTNHKVLQVDPSKEIFAAHLVHRGQSSQDISAMMIQSDRTISVPTSTCRNSPSPDKCALETTLANNCDSGPQPASAPCVSDSTKTISKTFDIQSSLDITPPEVDNAKEKNEEITANVQAEMSCDKAEENTEEMTTSNGDLVPIHVSSNTAAEFFKLAASDKQSSDEFLNMLIGLYHGKSQSNQDSDEERKETTEAEDTYKPRRRTKVINYMDDIKDEDSSFSVHEEEEEERKVKKNLKKRGRKQRAPIKVSPKKEEGATNQEPVKRRRGRPRSKGIMEQAQKRFRSKNGTVHRCPTCNKVFKLRSVLVQHIRTHTGEKPFTCDVCGKAFSQSGNLVNHKQAFHSDVDRPFACELCPKTYKHRSNLNSHKKTHAGVRPHVCDVCGKAFLDKGGLKAHQRIHTGEKPYKCDKCDKDFRGLGTLRTHQRTHTKEKPFLCHICSKSFGTLLTLQRHGVTHTGERPYSCSICFKTFAHQCNMRDHERSHTGERPWKCDHPGCDGKFTKKKSLEDHKNIHLGLKPYVCDICCQSFASRKNLRRHKMIHEDVRPHPCSICKKSFLQKANLKRHLQTHIKRIVGEPSHTSALPPPPQQPPQQVLQVPPHPVSQVYFQDKMFYSL